MKNKLKKKKKEFDLTDLAIAAGIGYGIYKIFFSNSGSNQHLTQSEIDKIFISKLGVRSNTTYDPAFNEAWAMALQQGSSIFNLEGKNYSAQTGKAL